MERRRTDNTGEITSVNMGRFPGHRNAILAMLFVFMSIYLWVIIGCSVGGALVLTIIIAVLVYLRRRLARAKVLDMTGPSYVPGPEFCKPRMSPSSFSSSSSDDISETMSPEGNLRRPLGPSASLDPPSLLRMTSECVQPRPALTRWHTVGSPHCQTTAVPGTVDTETYRGSDDDDPGSPTCINGRLWFSFLYHPNLNKMDVTLIRAKNLPGRGLTNSPRDPFVKIFLLPDEETYHQSKMRKRTLSPKFNETFSFHMTPEEIPHRTLRFSVYDVDKRKVRHSLGHVMFPLARVDLSTNEIVWKDLDTTSQQSSSLGELQLCLSCNPFTNRIKATVCRVRNIRGLEGDEANIYTKVQLYHGRKMIKSKRTILNHITSSSEEQELQFDETFNFAVSGRFFDSCSFTFTIMVAGPSPLVKDSPHGRVVIGPFMYARGEQLLHWQEMLTNPRNLVTRWHSLEPVQTS